MISSPRSILLLINEPIFAFLDFFCLAIS
jgi:hypothetical protein